MTSMRQLASLLILCIALLAGCVAKKAKTQPAYPSDTPSKTLNAPPEASPSPAPLLTSTPTHVWFALLGRTPVPLTTPLPPPARTVLDGTYGKLDPGEEMWLTKQPWLSCQPPNPEAAISDHWIRPPGCTP